MLQKNKEKQERKQRRQTFVGIRPARFEKKTAYNRAKAKAETRYQETQPPEKFGGFSLFCPGAKSNKSHFLLLTINRKSSIIRSQKKGDNYYDYEYRY